MSIEWTKKNPTEIFRVPLWMAFFDTPGRLSHRKRPTRARGTRFCAARHDRVAVRVLWTRQTRNHAIGRICSQSACGETWIRRFRPGQRRKVSSRAGSTFRPTPDRPGTFPRDTWHNLRCLERTCRADTLDKSFALHSWSAPVRRLSCRSGTVKKSSESINQSIEPSINQSIEKSIDESINQSV